MASVALQRNIARPWRASSFRFTMLAMAAVLTAVAAWRVALWMERRGSQEIAADAAARAQRHAALAADWVDRRRGAPVWLAGDAAVIAAAAQPTDAAGLAAATERLTTAVGALGLESAHLYDATGRAVASSAPAAAAAAAIGLGDLSRPNGDLIRIGGRPFFGLSHPVVDAHGRRIGAVAAIVSFDVLTRAWRAGGEMLHVADAAGGVVAATIAAPPPLHLQDAEAWSLTLGRDVHVATADAPGVNWTVRVFAPLDGARLRAANAALATGVVGLTLAAAFALAMERRAADQRRVEEGERRRVELDALVQARTAALEHANLRLKEAQADLIHASKLAALGGMASSLAHEIGQPLGEIRALAEQAQLLANDPCERDQALGDLVARTERLAAVARHLRAFARQAPKELGAVRLRPLLEQAAGVMEAAARRGDVVLRIETPDELAVWGEETRLEQVFVNLIQNAVDAMPRGGSVSLTARAVERSVAIHVIDEGPGLSDDAMQRAFDSFYTTKPPGAGLGLGLSIARAIVEEFGGVLAAQNRCSGGAEFVVRLPRALA